MKLSKFFPLFVLTCLLGFHLGLSASLVRGEPPTLCTQTVVLEPAGVPPSLATQRGLTREPPANLLGSECCDSCYYAYFDRLQWIDTTSEAKHQECGYPITEANVWCHAYWNGWSHDQSQYADEDYAACAAGCGGCDTSGLVAVESVSEFWAFPPPVEDPCKDCRDYWNPQIAQAAAYYIGACAYCDSKYPTGSPNWVECIHDADMLWGGVAQQLMDSLKACLINWGCPPPYYMPIPDEIMDQYAERVYIVFNTAAR